MADAEHMLREINMSLKKRVHELQDALKMQVLREPQCANGR